MKLKPPTIVKEVRHFFGLTGYYIKFICKYLDITHPLNCLIQRSQPFMWTLECQSNFGMLCSRLANTSLVQLPNPNKPYLLFMDASKFCYSGIHTQASTDKSNKALLKLLTDNYLLKSVHSQTQNLLLNSIVLPVAYISGSFAETQCRWPAITRNIVVFYVNQESVPFI